MEMLVTLRTLLRRFEFATTNAAGERNHSRGVVTAPGRGGRAVIYRRTSDDIGSEITAAAPRRPMVKEDT
jgi:hypothetical protein